MTARFLVRLSGELNIKSDRVRSRFQKILVGHLRDSLGAENSVANAWSRLFVSGDPAAIQPILSRSFGIISFSPILRASAPTMDEISAIGLEVFREHVRGKRFAVRARRSGSHVFTSMEINIKLGESLKPFSSGVDLTSPEVVCSVEVRPDEAVFFVETLPGPGGLPIGAGGHAVSLLSGGFDSAVASWMMLKRGLHLDLLFCNVAGKAYEKSVLSVAKVLQDRWSPGVSLRLHSVDFSAVVAMLRAKVRHSHVQVLLKRMFYRTATLLADAVDADGIITGEAVGQVSSQTIANLRAIEDSVALPVLRPLCGYDKDEIISLSRKLGFFETCSVIQEHCALVPDKPVTACRVAVARREEEACDLDLLAQAVAQRQIFDLAKLTAADFTGPYVFVDSVPESAQLLDCRERYEFDIWHPEGALHLDSLDSALCQKALDKSRTYVLYCGQGMTSAILAESLQAKGYAVYSLRGGMQSLR